MHPSDASALHASLDRAQVLRNEAAQDRLARQFRQAQSPGHPAPAPFSLRALLHRLHLA